MHATMLLNAADGGSRRCVLVTNNEVNSEAAERLIRRGHFRGDPDFEAAGVFEMATRPRVTAAVTGLLDVEPWVAPGSLRLGLEAQLEQGPPTVGAALLEPGGLGHDSSQGVDVDPLHLGERRGSNRTSRSDTSPGGAQVCAGRRPR